MSRKERRLTASQGGWSSLVTGTAVTIASVACYGAANAVAKHLNRKGQNATVPPYIAQQIEDGALPSDADSDYGNETAVLARRNGSSDLDESAALFEGANIVKLTEDCDSYPTSHLVELYQVCATELKLAVESRDYKKIRAFTDMQQVLDKLLQVHRQQKDAYEEMNTSEIKRLTEEVVKRVKELKKCQDAVRKMYPSDEASEEATRHDEGSTDWLSNWFTTPPKSKSGGERRKQHKRAASIDRQRSTRRRKVVPSNNTNSVATAPVLRKKKRLCRMEFCEKVSDGSRSDHMCRRHFRFATEARMEPEEAGAEEDNEVTTDKKPAALAYVVESCDDISQLGESQDTLLCLPTSQPDNTEVTNNGRIPFDPHASLGKKNTFLNYPKDRCCHCDKEGTEAAPLYECTCTEKLMCRRRWHMQCQNELLSDAGQREFLRINPKTFHCSECKSFETFSEKEQLDFLLKSNDDANDDDVSVLRSGDSSDEAEAVFT